MLNMILIELDRIVPRGERDGLFRRDEGKIPYPQLPHPVTSDTTDWAPARELVDSDLESTGRKARMNYTVFNTFRFSPARPSR